MLDVNYFLDQAKNSNQEEFNEDWADVIIDIDYNYSVVFTEDRYTLKIYWITDGKREGEYDHHHISILNK